MGITPRMHRFTRAVGALAISALVSAGLAVGLSTPAQAKDLLPGVPDALAVVSGPVLSGTGDVGSTLTRTLPVWNIAGVTNSTRWLSDGDAIPGATGATYVPTAADAGSTVQAAVTGTLLNLVPLTAYSNAIPVPAAGGADPGDPGDPGDVLSALVDPVLNGNPAVGSLLTVTAPAWSLPGVATTYQWLRDGVPIPGADDPFYVPTVDDAGHQISASVSGALLGLPGVSLVTESLGIPLSSGSAVSPASDVAITGTRKIGTALALTGPTWEPADATNTYQWLRDEAPIASATAATYRLVPSDVGYAISVKVTGHKDGWTDNTITSEPVTPVIGDPIQFLLKPRLTGTGNVGKLLTADPGVWGSAGEDGAAPTFSYQWNRNGVAIPGAVAQTYQAQLADAGRSLTVTVKATRPAYKPGTFTTAGITVAKVATSLQAKTAKSTIKKGRAAVLALLLKAPGVAKPAGVVTVFDGKKLLKKLTLAPGKRGMTSVRLAGLKPGLHRLTAVYAGSPTLAGATSKVVRLKVATLK
jgi:hypothetical protein